MAMLRLPRAGALLLGAAIVAGAGLVEAGCKCDKMHHYSDPVAHKLVGTDTFKIGATRSTSSAAECAGMCLALSDDAEPCAAFQVSSAASECHRKLLIRIY